VDARFLVGVLPALKRDDGVRERGGGDRGDPRRPEATRGLFARSPTKFWLLFQAVSRHTIHTIGYSCNADSRAGSGIVREGGPEHGHVTTKKEDWATEKKQAHPTSFRSPYRRRPRSPPSMPMPKSMPMARLSTVRARLAGGAPELCVVGREMVREQESERGGGRVAARPSSPHFYLVRATCKYPAFASNFKQRTPAQPSHASWQLCDAKHPAVTLRLPFLQSISSYLGWLTAPGGPVPPPW